MHEISVNVFESHLLDLILMAFSPNVPNMYFLFVLVLHGALKASFGSSHILFKYPFVNVLMHYFV